MFVKNNKKIQHDFHLSLQKKVPGWHPGVPWLDYTPVPLFITFCQMFGKRPYTNSASIFVAFHINRPLARISSSLVLYRVPRSGSCSTTFVQYSGENDDTWWYRTPSFSITMQGVTPLLSRTSCAAGNGRFWDVHLTHPI